MRMYDVGVDVATIVWFDPGVTTGIAVLSVNPSWLDGAGRSDWRSLGLAVEGAWHEQVGRHARTWNIEDDKAERLYSPQSQDSNYFNPERKLEVRRTSRVKSSERTDPKQFKVIRETDDNWPGSVEEILAGKGLFGGAEPTTILCNEIEVVRDCQNMLDNYPDAAWGYEDFILRQMNQTREFIAPVRLFSMLAYSEIIHGLSGRIPFVQSASTAKATATDERLQEAGLYRAGMPHATDAMRHATTFLRRCRADAEIRAQAWPLLFGASVEPTFEDLIPLINSLAGDE